MAPSPETPDWEPIRTRFRAQHDAGLSWQALADQHGLTKGELHAFAVKGHTPRNQKIVARLLGATEIDIVIQHRDRAGRFTARNT